MPKRLQCEFSLVRYVPDVVKGEFANIGVVLREAGRNDTATVRFTRDWNLVRCLDPEADMDLLESLELEIQERLQTATGLQADPNPILEMLENSLSNCLQLTEMRGTLAESLPAEMGLLLKMYVNPRRMNSKNTPESGRAAIWLKMRDAFENVGVWNLMRKKIAAAAYTQAGDTLTLDCGYRNGDLRIFHAVSLENGIETAKVIAYSANILRAGVLRNEGVKLELNVFVEMITSSTDRDQYSFGVSILEEAGIRVLTVEDLSQVADSAKRELKAS